MTRKQILFIFLLYIILLTGCDSDNNNNRDIQSEEKQNVITALYTIDYFSGYKFSDDGTVIYYKANWYKKKNEPTGCRPEYWYGTYKLDGASLTITISGIDTPITGVFTDDKVIIDGTECKLKTDVYYEEGSHESWKELDKALGLVE